jgi:hypothetical protein
MKYLKKFESIDLEKEELEDYFLVLMEGGIEINEPLFKPKVKIYKGTSYYMIVIDYLDIDKDIINSYVSNIIDELKSKYIVFYTKDEAVGFANPDINIDDDYPNAPSPIRKIQTKDYKYALYRKTITLAPRIK